MILKETTEAEALKLASSGEIHDLAYWPLTENDSIFKVGKRISSPVASTWIIGVNTLKSPFKSIKTRQLFKVSVPVDDFRKTFYPDSIKANGYVPNGLTGSQVKVELKVTDSRPPKDKITIAIPRELARGEEMKKMIFLYRLVISCLE